MDEIMTKAERKMKKTISLLADEFAGIRAGRANPELLDKISVDYYGTPTPIHQIAAISVTEARVLLIQPWDASICKGVEKAIQKSDLGVNPQNDGKIIRLVFPPLTEERRKILAKDVSKMAEEAKVAIRVVRRDSIEKLKQMKKKGEIAEDDLKQGEKRMQDLTDKSCKEIDAVSAEKTKEIMEI